MLNSHGIRRGAAEYMEKAGTMRWVAVLFLGLVLSGAARADVATYYTGVGNKIDRGFCNVLGAPILEIPYQVYSVSKEKNVLAGGTIGVARGIVTMPLRVLSGSYDLITFCIPIPRDFGSLIKPDYIPWVGDTSAGEGGAEK